MASERTSKASSRSNRSRGTHKFVRTAIQGKTKDILRIFQGEIYDIDDAWIPNTDTFDSDGTKILAVGLPQTLDDFLVCPTILETECLVMIEPRYMITTYSGYKQHLYDLREEHPDLEDIADRVVEGINDSDISWRQIELKRRREERETRSHQRNQRRSSNQNVRKLQSKLKKHRVDWENVFTELMMNNARRKFWKNLGPQQGLRALRPFTHSIVVSFIIWRQSGKRLLRNICGVYEGKDRRGVHRFKEIDHQRFYALFGAEYCMRRDGNETRHVDIQTIEYRESSLKLTIKWSVAGFVTLPNAKRQAMMGSVVPQQY